ncbi:TonB-dependent receptor plug domain-containing protein [Roseisolibacter sp. H3M3-2]|uniref:TonB-dependent receptor n=1 Tax=Roseisolibacter sp. H3M3-2 TaxID=3031323 RepID=UPI0023DC6B50|nr:TonB-dependent receptor plug domain-containing protein [Roseisolibacter sp. H3M3-2]MDF1501405.1 TonB-dependent receptor [Roseisolibacter sp. H3M3-2]
MAPSRVAAPVLAAFVPGLLAAQPALRGRAYDTYTQAPLAGVTVTPAGGSPVVTDRDGRFSVPCAAPVALTFRRLGYEPLRAEAAACSDFVQAGLTPGAQSLNEVAIVETRESPGAAGVSQPLSVSTVTRQELRRGSGVFPEEALDLVPGVRFERRTMAGGQRITIRGYGNRSNFDGSGYKAYLNGIPLTDAEGITVLDDVDFASLGRVDVVRGPASSLFGAGIGGVVNLYTLRPDRPGTTAEQEVLAGQDGLVRSDSRLTHSTGGSNLVLNYGRQRYDSYRIHSGSRKDFATFVGDFRPSERRTISTFLSYANSRDDRAGQLDSAQFFGRRDAGEAPYLANDAHVNLESFRAGVTHGYRVSDAVETVATAYYSGGSREDVFAAGVNPKSAQTFGARAVFNTRFLPAALGGRPITGVTGGEFEKTNAFVKGYRLTNKVLGAPTNDTESSTMQYNVFSQWDVGLPADVALTVGASVNFIEYALLDRLANASNPTRKPITGRKTYDPVVIPRVALRRTFGDAFSVYGTVSQGFTPATSSDAVIQFTGQANEGIKPERGTLYEVGSKGNLFGRRLGYQLALFDLRVSDKLTTQSVFDATGSALYSFTVNAGDQSNRGAELALAYALVERPGGAVASLRPFLSYTYSDFTYTDFKSDANGNARTVDYGGNRVVGVPRHVVAGGVDLGVRGGGYGSVTVERRGAVPLTYDNRHEAPAYTLLNAKVGAARDFRNVRVDAYVGGQNLTGGLYYTMAFLNGNYAAASPAVFLPGPYDARFYAGVKLGLLR